MSRSTVLSYRVVYRVYTAAQVPISWPTSAGERERSSGRAWPGDALQTEHLRSRRGSLRNPCNWRPTLTAFANEPEGPPGRTWPISAEGLVEWQARLSQCRPSPWAGAGVVGGCFVCFPRGESGPGRRGDRGWAAAAVLDASASAQTAVATGEAGAPYVPGLLALREGPLLEAAVRALPRAPDVLLVDATGRDHPRRAGLAISLGAVLDLPTIGVTHRPLLAVGDWPADRRGATAPLRIEEETVGSWLRVRAGVRPLAIHPAWRTDLDIAIAVVLAATWRARTPEPLRVARTVARRARTADRR